MQLSHQLLFSIKLSTYNNYFSLIAYIFSRRTTVNLDQVQLSLILVVLDRVISVAIKKMPCFSFFTYNYKSSITVTNLVVTYCRWWLTTTTRQMACCANLLKTVCAETIINAQKVSRLNQVHFDT